MSLSIFKVFGAFSAPVSHREETYFNDAFTLYRYKNEKLNTILEKSSLTGTYSICGGLYVRQADDLVGVREDLGFAINDLSNSFCFVEAKDSVAYIQEDFIGENRLVICADGTSIQSEDIGAYYTLDFDGEYLVTIEDDNLTLFDSKMNKKWSINKYANSSFDRRYKDRMTYPKLVDGFIVASSGCYKKDTYSIFCLNPLDGSVRWEYHYSENPRQSYLYGNKYFLLTESLKVIDLNSGNVDLAIQLGMKGEYMAWPIGEKFLIYCNEDRLIRIIDQDNKTISNQTLPEPYIFDVEHSPTEINGNIFIRLDIPNESLRFARCGFAVLTKDSDLNELIVEEDIAMPMMEVRTPEGEKRSVFTVSCDNIDDLRRKVAIVLGEYAITIGNSLGVDNISPDPEHKGHIKVVVDATDLPENSEQILKEWAHILEDYFERMAIYPGAGEDYRYKFDIEMS